MAGGVFRLRIDPRVFTCEFTLSTFVFYLVYKRLNASIHNSDTRIYLVRAVPYGTLHSDTELYWYNYSTKYKLNPNIINLLIDWIQLLSI